MRIKLLIAAILLLYPTGLFAAEEKQIFEFASSLYDSGNYYGSVLESQRLLSYYPSSAYSEEATLMIAKSYLGAGRTDDCGNAFESFFAVYPGSRYSRDALFMLARNYFSADRYDAGIYKLYVLKNERFSGNAFHSDTAEYLIGWGYLGKHDFPLASAAFYYLGTREGEYRENSVLLARDASEGLSLPSKSPFLAGTLAAVMPGAGHVYAERYYDGLMSFLLNGIFIFLAADSYNSGNNGAGLFFSVIELGWYTGNIYGAVGAAHRYNEIQKDEYVKGLKLKYGIEF